MMSNFIICYFNKSVQNVPLCILYGNLISKKYSKNLENQGFYFYAKKEPPYWGNMMVKIEFCKGLLFRK